MENKDKLIGLCLETLKIDSLHSEDRFLLKCFLSKLNNGLNIDEKAFLDEILDISVGINNEQYN